MQLLSSPRRRIGAGLAVLGMATVVLAMVPWRIGPGPMRAEAERRIRLALAAPAAEIGRMSLSLLPTPQLQVDSISFTRPDGSLSGMARSASVAIKLDSLVRGVAKPASLTLVKPTLSVRLASNGGVIDRAQAVRAALVGMLSTGASLNGLTEIAVEDGRLHLGDGADTLLVEALNLNASLSAADRPLRVSGHGRVGGQDMRLAFAGASPVALRAGTEEPIVLNLTTPALNVEFRGTGSLSRDIAVKGLLAVDVSDKRGMPLASAPLAVALSAIGVDGPSTLRLRAGLSTAARSATFSDLSVLTSQNRFDGVGALRLDGQRWHVSATLATPTLNLTPPEPLLARTKSPDGGWNHHRFDPSVLFGLNLDLRISAEKAQIGPHVLTRAGMAVMARPDRIEASLNDATFHGGRARGRLIATRNSGMDYRLSAGLEGVDFGKMAEAAKLPPRLTGAGNAEVAVEASGLSPAEIAASIDGKLGLTLRAGEIAGVDLNRLANRRGSRPDQRLTEALGGRTPFEGAALTARIQNGQAKPVEGSFQASRLVGALSGDVDLYGDEIRLNGNVVQIPAEPGVVDPLPVIEFTIGGPLTEPRVTPNIASLLRRS